MTTTPYLSLPEIATGQSDKSVTYNGMLQILDIIVQRGIVDKDLSTPPGSPTTGAAYIVKATGTGAWASHDKAIAYYRGSWVFITPWEGLTFWVNDENLRYTYDGSAWATTIAFATAADYRANTASKVLTTDVVWSAADYVTLTDAATVAVDLSTGINFTVTLTDNRTLGNPSNTKNGQTGVIIVNQDGSGNRTLGYSSNWKFPAGATPTLSTAASARDMLFYQVISSSVIYGALVKGVA